MANTFTQIYIHIVFAVRGRQSLLKRHIREEVFKYIGGISRNQGQKLLIINGMSDHVHMLIGYKPTLALSDFVRDVKANSSGFIHEKKLTPGRFEWQEGYGAFSCSHADLDYVINYIRKQEEHHLRKTFKDEYLQLLKDFGVEYDSRYLFEWMTES